MIELLMGHPVRAVLVVLLAVLSASGCLAARPASPTATTQPPAASAASIAPIPPGLVLHRIEGRSESTLVADPAGRFLVYGGSWIFVSRDNGTTWTRTPHFGHGSDLDGLAESIDAKGRIFAVTTEGPNAVVARSEDGGATWTGENDASGLAEIADRPWIAAYADAQIVLMIGDLAVEPAGNYERCQTSLDGGATWLDHDITGSPGPTGGLAVDAQGVFYDVGPAGTLERFANRCLRGPDALPLFPNGTRGDELPIAVDGRDAYSSAVDQDGRLVIGGAREFHDVRQLVVSPPALHSGIYPEIAARDGIIAALWYGSTATGDVQQADYAGDLHVFVSIVHDFWGSPRVATCQLTATPAHHGTICQNGIFCGTSGRGPGDYFAIAFDAWGGLNVAFSKDGSDAGSFHARLTPELIG